MVYQTDNNANADWPMNNVMKSILLKYDHEPGCQLPMRGAGKYISWSNGMTQFVLRFSTGTPSCSR